MRKTFITKEYTKEPTAGTFSMKELRSFFSSKILEIEDTMTVDEKNLVWNESPTNTQGLGLESVQQNISMLQLKNNNHTLTIDQPQSEQQINEFTRWRLTVNIREIIKQWIFGKLKVNRTFAGIDNSKTLTGSINNSIYQYIEDNVYPRIEFFNIDLFVKYYRIGDIQSDNGNNVLDTNGNPIIAKKSTLQNNNSLFRDGFLNLSPLPNESTQAYQTRLNQYRNSLKIKNFTLEQDPNSNVATITFKQTEKATSFKFDYYFFVTWIKA